MNFCRIGAVALLVAALGGCATGYHAKGFTGGFSDTLLAPDMFRIRFAGNGFTDAERVSDFAMLRAADTSMDLGCGWFGVINETDGASTSTLTLSSAGWNRHGGWGFSNTVPVVKPNTSLLVKCTRSPPPDAELFDARFVARSIRAKYGLKPRHSPEPAIQPSVAAASPSAQTTIAAPVAGPDPATTPLRREYPRSPLAAGTWQAGAVTAEPAAASAGMAQESRPAATEGAADLGLQAYVGMVAAAQQVSSQIGCGTVRLSGSSDFTAACESYDVLIHCAGKDCRPMHTLPRP